MKDLIKKLKTAEPKNVVVVGDLMLDEYLIGAVGRISPEAPVPVLKEETNEFSFGGAANVAINCKYVGCTVDLIGLVGNKDEGGRRLISMLMEKNVLIEGIIKSPDRVTTRKKRIVSQNQQLLRIDAEDTHELSDLERDKIICNIHTVIKPGSTILISDYAKGIIDRQVIEEVVARAKICGSLVIVDPKGPNFDKYRGVHYIKPNLKEFYQMVEFFGFSKKDSVLVNARKICEELQIEGLIITMGEKGLHFISPLKEVFCPSLKREVFDITGAGDTVLAFLAVGLANGFSIEESIELANLAASVAVSHHKTYAVGLDELIDDNIESDEKIYTDWKSLRETLGWLRSQKKKKIVFTNGCFDLLHSGHIFLLQEAKKMGDILVVALNTDDSVRRYKGDSRPIKTLEERAKVMAAIDVVDYVVMFDQDTPYKLIDFLRPDVLVKGGDYAVEKIAGHDLVDSYGGKVGIIDYQTGLSTSGLVKRVKEQGV